MPASVPRGHPAAHEDSEPSDRARRGRAGHALAVAGRPHRRDPSRATPVSARATTGSSAARHGGRPGATPIPRRAEVPVHGLRHRPRRRSQPAWRGRPGEGRPGLRHDPPSLLLQGRAGHGARRTRPSGHSWSRATRRPTPRPPLIQGGKVSRAARPSPRCRAGRSIRPASTAASSRTRGDWCSSAPAPRAPGTSRSRTRTAHTKLRVTDRRRTGDRVVRGERHRSRPASGCSSTRHQVRHLRGRPPDRPRRWQGPGRQHRAHRALRALRDAPGARPGQPAGHAQVTGRRRAQLLPRWT